MIGSRFEPDVLARETSRLPALSLAVEPSIDGIRWHRPPFRHAGRRHGALLDALLEAWHRLLESLAFRQERIVNLGYVATTPLTEPLERLAMAIALRPLPPLAASTWLSVTVQPLAGSNVVDVPAGLAVQSVPVGAGRPQTFESDVALSARVEWNAIAAIAPPLAPPALSSAATFGFVAKGGLAVGDRVVVSGTRDGARLAAAVTLTGAELAKIEKTKGLTSAATPPVSGGPRKDPRWRKLSWSGPLLPAAPAGVITDAVCTELGPSAGVFGAQAEPWDCVADSVRYALSPARGGLRRLGPPSTRGTFSDRSIAAFARVAGEASAVGVGDGVWLASSSRGLYRSTDEGATWTRTGQRAWTARSMCSSDAGLLVGTASHGVIRSVDAALTWEVLRGGTVVNTETSRVLIAYGRLPRCAVGAIAAFSGGPGSSVVLAGTNSGLYYQQIGDPAWYPHAEGLPLVGSRLHGGGPAITAVVLEPASGALILGTARGLFRSAGLAQAWSAVAPFEDVAVSALGLDPAGAVLIGLESGGLYRMLGDAVSRVGPDSNNPFAALGVRAICSGGSSYWVGTDGGCFWSPDGAAWRRVTDEPTLSVAVLSDGGALVASRLLGSVAQEWPGFTLDTDHVDLDRLYPRAAPGPALAVDDTGRTLVLQVRRTRELERSDFGLRGRVTRLELEPEPALPAFSRRALRVFPALRELGPIIPALPPPSDAPPSLALAQLRERELGVHPDVPDPSGRTVLVSAPALRTRLAAGTALVEALSGATLSLTSETLATLTSVPVVREGVTIADVLTIDGVAGTVSVPQLGLVAGDPKSSPLVVRREVVGFSRSGTTAALVLDAGLGVPLDPTATTIYANVVPATHSQLVDREVLGSGDPSRHSQRFKLLTPLCWRPSEAGPAVPALEVVVSGHTWRRVEQRADLSPQDRAYVVETDMRGATWIQFGDGVNGQRPSAGVENITARYRSGGGAAGNQPAGAIRLLKGRPPGVKAARNLLVASGGADAESLDDLRARIPLHARQPEQVVSLPDYADHLATLPGIEKFAVQQLWNGHAHVVFITVATNDSENDWALDMDSELARALLALARETPVVFGSVEVVRFAVELAIAVEPDLDPDAVCGAVEQALAAAHGFAASAIGDAVLPSALVALAMGVPGVTNAAVRRLFPVAEPDASEVRALPAGVARLDPSSGTIRPGRLWLIAPAAPRPSPGTSAAIDVAACSRVGLMGGA